MVFSKGLLLLTFCVHVIAKKDDKGGTWNIDGSYTEVNGETLYEKNENSYNIAAEGTTEGDNKPFKRASCYTYGSCSAKFNQMCSVPNNFDRRSNFASGVVFLYFLIVYSLGFYLEANK